MGLPHIHRVKERMSTLDPTGLYALLTCTLFYTFSSFPTLSRKPMTLPTRFSSGSPPSLGVWLAPCTIPLPSSIIPPPRLTCSCHLSTRFDLSIVRGTYESLPLYQNLTLLPVFPHSSDISLNLSASKSLLEKTSSPLWSGPGRAIRIPPCRQGRGLK